MPFTYGTSEISFIARLSFRLYKTFKEAPGACADFSKELLSLQRILVQSGAVLDQYRELYHYDRFSVTLESFHEWRHLVRECREFLHNDVVRDNLPQKIREEAHNSWEKSYFREFGNEEEWIIIDDLLPMHFRAFRESIRQVRFSKKIPMLQWKIDSLARQLTALNIHMIQSFQLDNFSIQSTVQRRLEDMNGTLIDIRDSQTRIEESQARIEKHADEARLDNIASATTRMEESQSRLEEQLQQILNAPQRRGTPLLSHSLDASSPAGRQTWMELGRLLRDEGISPNVIKNNKKKLITAMKQALAESIPESFHTASEYPLSSGSVFSVASDKSLISPPPVSIASLGSAPPSHALFPASFLMRHGPQQDALEEEDNLTTGMENLMQGMDEEDEESAEWGDQEDALPAALNGTEVPSATTKAPVNRGWTPMIAVRDNGSNDNDGKDRAPHTNSVEPQPPIAASQKAQVDTSKQIEGRSGDSPFPFEGHALENLQFHLQTTYRKAAQEVWPKRGVIGDHLGRY